MSARSARSSTSASSESLPLAWRSASSSTLRSKWSSMAFLPRPVMMRMSSMPLPHRLLHHVLDGRLVDDRQHLLRLRLGGGEEPGAQTGGGDDGLADVGHGARFYSLASASTSAPRRDGAGRGCRGGGRRRARPRPRTPPPPRRAARPARRRREARRPPPPSPPTRRRSPSPPPPTPPPSTSVTPGQQHQRHPRAGGHALAAAEPPGDRGHVAEHGGQPARHPDGRGCRWPARPPAASAPLATSPSSTTAPARRPIVRKVLDAPGLPEPSWVGSRPSRRPTRIAVGKVPSR